MVDTIMVPSSPAKCFLLCRILVIALIALSLFVEARAQAPVITEQPRALVVGPGDQAGFAVTASGAAPLNYHWYRNGIPVPDVSSDLLLLPNVQAAQAGDYTVTVSNLLGSVVSTAVHLDVAAYTKERIDPTFRATDSSIKDPILLLPDGRLIVTRNQPLGLLVCLGPDGTPDLSFSFTMPSEVFGPSVFWTPLKMAQQDDGRILIIGAIDVLTHGGTFRSYLLIRLNKDGSRDLNFTQPLEAGSSISPQVLLPVGDKIIIAVAGKLVRLNRDGSVDTTFVSAAANAPGEQVPVLTHAVLDKNGNILAGGGSYLWRLHSEGARDASFPLVALGGTVVDLAAQKDGSCFVGTTEARSGSYDVTYRLRRLTATGEVDAGFREFSCVAFGATNFSVQLDGRVVVTGGFDLHLPTGEEGREAVHTRIVRLMTDGSIDSTFAPTDDNWWGKLWMLPDGIHALASNGKGLWRLNLSTLGVIEPPRILRVTPERVTTLAGDDVTVRVAAVGPSPIQIGGGESATTLSGDLLTFRDVQGELQVSAKGPGGRATRNINMDFSPSAPRIIEPTESVVARPGQQALFTLLVRGSYPLTYQVFKDGALIYGTELNRYDEGVLEFSVGGAVADADVGIYSVRVTNSFGAAECSSTLTVGSSSELANLSVRAAAGTGDDVMIVGFVLKNRKQVLFQAIGPELVNHGVSGVLADPTATLFSSNGSKTSNDNGGNFTPWEDPLYRQLGATPLDGPTTKSSELRGGLRRGVNTIVVSGVGATTGVALAQLFDADNTTNRIVNLSARVYAGTGSATAITGFIIRGDQPKKVLIRCVGPGLADAGVANPLLDPSLTLVDQATHETLATNDDWGSAQNIAELKSVMQAVGAFPLAVGSKDSAMVITLPPGAYTALVLNVWRTSKLL